MIDNAVPLGIFYPHDNLVNMAKQYTLLNVYSVVNCMYVCVCYEQFP